MAENRNLLSSVLCLQGHTDPVLPSDLLPVGLSTDIIVLSWDERGHVFGWACLHILSWLGLGIEILSTFTRDGSTNSSPKVSSDPRTLRSKERESTTTALSREPYGACVILGGSFWGTERLLIVSWCEDLTEVLAFLSVRKLSGTVRVHLEGSWNHQFEACKPVYSEQNIVFLRKRSKEEKKKTHQYLLSKMELDYITFMSSVLNHKKNILIQ